MEESIAVPRAGDAVAEASAFEAGAKLDVLSTGKRPVMMSVELVSSFEKARSTMGKSGVRRLL